MSEQCVKWQTREMSKVQQECRGRSYLSKSAKKETSKLSSEEIIRRKKGWGRGEESTTGEGERVMKSTPGLETAKHTCWELTASRAPERQKRSLLPTGHLGNNG